LPFDATARVLQLMAHRGLLRVEQGMAGGYSILRELNKVTFLELIEVIEGPVEIARCLNDRHECDLHSTCNIQSPVTTLNRRIEQFYQTLYLADLLRLKEPNKGTVRISS